MNTDFVQVTADLGERYAQAKTNISWAEGEDRIGKDGHSLPAIVELRRTMVALHRAWPGSTYASAEFPALLDQFEATWPQLMTEYQAAR